MLHFLNSTGNMMLPVLTTLKDQDLLSKGGRPIETGNNMLPVLPTLRELGIEKVESQRWQRIAAILV